ncbi:futalosine hydrolase [Brevibacillus sp. SYSU BS000544]|uniref:futalosine hydrolase n=1 Tax=Brevibacillus sp. SYSU BS000544 TaxID=3416443 RepID=UPI003CE46846
MKKTKALVMTSVSVEQEAVLRGLRGSDRFDVKLAGVGPAAAAASTATALAKGDYHLVVNMGIGGGFVGQAEVGSLVVASEIIAADLGAQTSEGFCSLDELGFGTTRFSVDANLVSRISEALVSAGLSVKTGPVLTVSTVTGTAETAAELVARIPGASIESMEGYGVATAAHFHNVPVLEIRAVSNPVGPRDRAAWRIPEALQQLELASRVLLEVLS